MIHRAARSIFLAGVLSSAVAVPVDVKLATLVAKVESMSSKNATATNMVRRSPSIFFDLLRMPPSS